jgi:hypothetical protein
MGAAREKVGSTAVVRSRHHEEPSKAASRIDEMKMLTIFETRAFGLLLGIRTGGRCYG